MDAEWCGLVLFGVIFYGFLALAAWVKHRQSKEKGNANHER